MSNDKSLRSLNVQIANWFPVSWDVGRDETLCAIEDEAFILPALGLMIAGTALCLSKDDDWLSRNEVFRIAVPGTRESKTAAAEALCSVRLWQEEEREGVQGWRLGVAELLQGKRDRHNKAKKAAEARYGRTATPQTVVRPLDDEEESPF